MFAQMCVLYVCIIFALMMLDQNNVTLINELTWMQINTHSTPTQMAASESADTFSTKSWNDQDNSAEL